MRLTLKSEEAAIVFRAKKPRVELYMPKADAGAKISFDSPAFGALLCAVFMGDGAEMLQMRERVWKLAQARVAAAEKFK